MTVVKKVSIVVVVIILGIGAVNLFYASKKYSGSHQQNDVISKISTLEFREGTGKEEFQNKYYEAFIRYREALESTLDSNGNATEASVSSLVSLGQLHLSVGDLHDAEQSFLLALQFDKKNYLANGGLGDLYFRKLNEYEKAVPYFLAAIEVETPLLDSYYSELFELYHFHLNDTDAAEAILKYGIQRFPTHTDIIATLALLYEQRGDNKKAIEAYQELLRVYPESTLAKQRIEALRS